MSTLEQVRALEDRHIVPTYKRQPVAFVRGRGSRLYDVDGREYLDLVSGIGVASLGHAHPGLSAVIAEPARLANKRPATTGPSSRISESDTSTPSASEDP